MHGFGEFLENTWQKLRTLDHYGELSNFALLRAILCSLNWNDDHNAAEMLMGAWSRLREMNGANPANFRKNIELLPNYDRLARVSFFSHWMREAFPATTGDGGPSECLSTLKNIGCAEPRAISISLDLEDLSLERYVQMSQIAYHDAVQPIEGLGGLVALADANAEVQEYNPRYPDRVRRSSILFRNAAALNLAEVTDSDTLPALAMKGSITILEVQLGHE